MRVFCTGISGTDKKSYLEKMAEEENKKNSSRYVKIYNMGDLMFEMFDKHFPTIQIKRDNILHVREDLRKAAISLAFKEVIKDSKRYKHQILNSHEWFFDKKQYSTANSGYDIAQLNPDMFITFISQSKRIKKLLDQKERWEEQNLSLDEILTWQNLEVEGTAKSAEFLKKEREHYIFSSNEPTSVLAELLHNPRKEIAYASFPMTNIKTEEGRKEIDDFVSKLREHFIVLDPRSIEVTKASTQTMKEQTVRRDMVWYISKVEKVICFYPGELVYTAGAVNEVNESYETGKDTWIVGLKSQGPFEDHFSTKRFESKETFYKFLDKEYFKDQKTRIIKRF